MNTYKIQSGDTLGAIAARNGTTVRALQQLNPTITDPNKIYAGQTLNLASAPTSTAAPATPSFMVNQPMNPVPVYGSAKPIPIDSITGTTPPPVLPQPVNTTPGVRADLNAKVSSVNNNFQNPDYGIPISGVPTVPFITVGGKNYAADPANRVFNSAGGASTTTTPRTDTTGQDMSTKTGLQNRLLELLGVQGTKGAKTAEAMTAAGVDAKYQKAIDLQNEALTLKNSYDNQIRELRQSNPTGQLSGVQQETIDKLARTRDQALADNAIQQLVAQNNYSGALKMASAKVDAEFQPIQDQIDTLKTYYTFFQNDMTESEKLKAQQAFQSKENQLEYDRQVALLKEKAAIESSMSTKAPEVKSINGIDSQWDVTSRQWKPLSVAGSNGGATNTLKLAQAESNISQITELANNLVSSAVGPNFASRTTPGFFRNLAKIFTVAGAPQAIEGTWNQLTGAQQNFIAGVEQLRSGLNLDSLIKAKANGATFGALSDQELKVLANSATKLGSWAIKDSSGNVVAYNASETDFKKELDKINNFAKLDYIMKGGSPEDVGAKVLEDGTVWAPNSDGSFTQIYAK